MTSENLPYNSFSAMMKKRYGTRIYKVPIDLGLGCPNRNIDGSGGCTFCPESGNRAQQTINAKSIKDQIEAGIKFARRRYGAKHFIAYIQAFTGTFAPASEQQQLYSQILDEHPFKALFVGTRPDCLPEHTLDYLNQLQEQLEVWVELGLQSTHDKTLIRINRQHDWSCSKKAINRLYNRAIPCVAHVILGLPGETEPMMLQTARRLAQLPIKAIKIHNLHVIRHTELAREYQNKTFPLFNEYDYCEILIKFVRHIPKKIALMRMATDTSVDELLAPKWSLDKVQFVEMFVRHMNYRECSQGDLTEDVLKIKRKSNLKIVDTKDGSKTMFSEEFKEHFHSSLGAGSEALEKYVRPAKLQQKLSQKNCRLLDICFGIGYNSFGSVQLALNLKNSYRLKIDALEINKNIVRQSLGFIEGEHKEYLAELYERSEFLKGEVEAKLHWGDARALIGNFENQSMDIVFLDAFSTQRNSELWTLEFFEKIRRVLKIDGCLLTYCAAGPVRGGLMKAGFFLGNTQAFGQQRPGTIATLNSSLIDFPLDHLEIENILHTHKGIPYRDPFNIASNREILKNREKTVTNYKLCRGGSPCPPVKQLSLLQHE